VHVGVQKAVLSASTRVSFWTLRPQESACKSVRGGKEASQKTWLLKISCWAACRERGFGRRTSKVLTDLQSSMLQPGQSIEQPSSLGCLQSDRSAWRTSPVPTYCLKEMFQGREGALKRTSPDGPFCMVGDLHSPMRTANKYVTSQPEFGCTITSNSPRFLEPINYQICPKFLCWPHDPWHSSTKVCQGHEGCLNTWVTVLFRGALPTH